jgi:hypothetical protein
VNEKFTVLTVPVPDILYGCCNFVSILGVVSGLYEMNDDPQPWTNKMPWIRNTVQLRCFQIEGSGVAGSGSDIF